MLRESCAQTCSRSWGSIRFASSGESPSAVKSSWPTANSRKVQHWLVRRLSLIHISIQGIKIHLLHVLEGTVLADQYRAGEFPLLTREEYVSVVCDQLELLPPQVVIQRLTGDGDREKLILSLIHI